MIFVHNLNKVIVFNDFCSQTVEQTTKYPDLISMMLVSDHSVFYWTTLRRVLFKQGNFFQEFYQISKCKILTIKCLQSKMTVHRWTVILLFIWLFFYTFPSLLLLLSFNTPLHQFFQNFFSLITPVHSEIFALPAHVF